MTLRTTTRDHGYPILQAKASRNGGRIIIAHRTDYEHQPFVVWREYGDGACEHGDYCHDLAEALRAFSERV